MNIERSIPELALRVYECGSLPAALQVLADSLPTPGGSVFLLDDNHEGRLAVPANASLPEYLNGARPAAESPVLQHGPGRVALLLPLGSGGGLVVLEARAETFGDDPGSWERVRRSLVDLRAQEQRLAEAQAEVEVLRRRAEESEALHTLGLAANRTLDPDEVLTLVARFTRTLLGGHYATVSTRHGNQVRTLAAVGLRSGGPEMLEDPFARRVVASGRALSTADGTLSVKQLPPHVEQGMQSGLGVPLSLFGETFGALVVGYRRPYAPTSHDVRLALTLAGHAAVAISNAQLHRALADRSAELERTNEALKRASEAKELFFASVSHELRTPLNGVLGYNSLLLEGIAGELPPTAHSFLTKANDAAQNLLRLVNDLLDLAKIESGKLELDVSLVAPRTLFDEVLVNVEPLIAEKQLQTTMAVDAGMGMIHTDSHRVQQILLNLLSNAVKFTPTGGAILMSAVEASPLEASNQAPWVEFRVQDTGPGIPAEDRARIFAEFEQVRGTKGGTGLGLPISRKLARLLGGDLCVEDGPGGGAVFVLKLPRAGPPLTGT